MASIHLSDKVYTIIPIALDSHSLNKLFYEVTFAAVTSTSVPDIGFQNIIYEMTTLDTVRDHVRVTCPLFFSPYFFKTNLISSGSSGDRVHISGERL